MTIDLSKHVPAGERQRILYTFRVSIYAPAALAAVSLSDEEAQDARFDPVPTYVGVPCLYEATPEMTTPDAIGLNKLENVFTSDKFYFEADVSLNDGYLIKMTSCQAPNSLVGRCWVTQGNSQINNTSTRRPVNNQWIYSKLSPTDLIPA